MKQESFEEFFEEKEPIRGPYKLPEGWKWIKVKRISEKPQYGYSAPAKNNSIGPKMLRISDIQDGNVNWNSVPFCIINKQEAEKYKLVEGDILFARTGATTGKTYLIKDCPEAIFASYLIRLKIDKSKVSPEYVYLFFQSPHYWMQIKPRGGAQPNMNAKILSKILIPIPSILEQNRIVARIKELFSKIDEIKKLRKEASEQAKALLQSALHKVFSKTDEKSWQLVRLGDIDIAEINPSKKEIRNVPDNTIISFIPMEAVDEIQGKIEKTELKELGEVRKGYTYFKEGDVIFAKITPCMENGKCAIAESLSNKLGFGSTEFHVIRPLNSLLSRWIYLFLRQESIRKKAIKYFTGSVGQQRVPKEFLENLFLPLPSLEEQKRLVAYLDEFQKNITTLQKLQEETEKELELIRESILHTAFRGEL